MKIQAALLLLVITIIHCTCLNHVISGLCLDDQRSWLLQFKNNLTFDHSIATKLSSWNESTTPYCEWGGVTCDHHAHVIALDLSGETIHGALDNSSSLFGLQHLQFLNLATNFFSSSIPCGFNKLKNLTHLNLAGWLCGTSSNRNISTYKLVQNLTNIRNLYLDEVSISGEGHEWYDAFLLLPHLQELSMIGCGLMGTFPPEIFQITTLSNIDISGNADLHGSFPDFPLNGSFHTITVADTNFSGRLPLSIGNMVHLSSLDLSHCNFSGTIPSKLFELREIDDIDLSHNKFIGAIPSLSKAKKLAYLDLSANGLTGPISSSAQFEGMQSLLSINLSYNSISGSIPSSLFMIPSLEEVYLSNNQFSKLEESTGVFSLKLYTLDISYNNLSGSIPSFIFQLSGLSYLQLGNNKLLWPITSSIIQLRNLVQLDLSSNKLNGPLPIGALAQLENLSDLDLSFNKIDDVNVTHVVNSTFPQLSSLTMAYCNLKTFPDFLRSEIGVLNLGSNKLTGHIPDTFPSSCALQTIVLNGNQLAGSLPKSLEHCIALEVLDVGRNQTIGAFPCFLSHITTLRVLVLRNNKFHGPMGCHKDNSVWNMIQIVDVAFNNFSGELPVNWFRGWKKMISNDDGVKSEPSNIQFDVYQNFMLPDYQDSIMIISKGQEMELVKILTIFTSIDFSYNQFEGAIPKELMDFKALHLLNLSHNALSGQIPSSIGNLNQLESLDLSMNSLEREIPSELANLNFLSYLNLSFNHLTGKIPTGTQLQSFEASSFEGNDGLYGPPLTKTPNHGMHPLPPLPEQPPCGSLACEVHWNLVSAEVGLVFGLGSIIGPLLFWKRWRMRYCQFLDKILCRIFPQLCHEYERRGGQTYRVLLLARRIKSRRIEEFTAKNGDLFSIWNYDGKIAFEDTIEATQDFDIRYCIGTGAYGIMAMCIEHNFQVAELLH
ncbi:hypothetical protein PIB30_055068 [Stylosanthes scabra]|uniref:Leucine-rich repeat-containing N-terminal plant-type domain-containing protein n=1 Tax=Stylosanthes scabra TaxID=79078 RepID=A0ABU6YGE1_9FABA|nr:hypothetical protein [Stylosanthes scabra]